MGEIFVCSAAERDYTESLTWYAKHSLEAAGRFEAAVDLALTMIAANPERYPMCDNRHRYFLLQDFPHQVVYRMSGADICVVAIAHTSREPSYWSGR